MCAVGCMTFSFLRYVMMVVPKKIYRVYLLPYALMLKTKPISSLFHNTQYKHKHYHITLRLNCANYSLANTDRGFVGLLSMFLVISQFFYFWFCFFINVFLECKWEPVRVSENNILFMMTSVQKRKLLVKTIRSGAMLLKRQEARNWDSKIGLRSNEIYILGYGLWSYVWLMIYMNVFNGVGKWYENGDGVMVEGLLYTHLIELVPLVV